MILKPFLLYEVIIVFLDYIRLYLVAGLAFRNPAGLGLLALAFISFVWACMILFNSLVLKYRRDLRISYMTIFVFPFYKVCVFFPLALFLLSTVPPFIVTASSSACPSDFMRSCEMP